jgi:hypothetical protein
MDLAPLVFDGGHQSRNRGGRKAENAQTFVMHEFASFLSESGKSTSEPASCPKACAGILVA